MTVIITIAVSFLIAVLACGTEAVAKGLSEFSAMAVRIIGAGLMIALSLFLLFWLVQMMKTVNARPIVRTETVFIISYFLGSIPFGLLLTKFAGFGDIRKIGSGNIGATNVLRTGSKELAALTLFLDGAKGVVAVVLAQTVHPAFGPLAGLIALLGHLYPVWLNFRGGKGVATAIGVILALSWPIGLVVMAMWFLVAMLFRYSSLAAIIAIGLSPLYAYLLKRPDLIWLTVAIVFFIVLRHADNIQRLVKGKEPKIGSNKKKNAPLPS
jgi:glycerol-3-phosphate acyltransferase PlsY